MAIESPIDPSSGSTAQEAPPPSTTPRRNSTRIILLAALGVALVWLGFTFVPALLNLGSSGDERGALTYQVGRNPLQVIVSAEGNVESASNIEVKCRVAGGSTILWIVEDGKLVEEGEEIVRLDTSVIDDKLNSQRITFEKAQATEIQAREDLASAEISVKEYEEGTFVEQLQQVEADIRIAMENLRSAENQVKYSERMVRKGFVSSLQREADEFAVERTKLDLAAANTRKKVLVDFTKQKTVRDLVAKREAAAARLRSEQAGLQLEKARLDRLQEQLKNCVITAPKKGMAVYANDSRSRYGSSQQSQVEEGAVVREGQALVRLPDLARMQVKVTIHESRIDQIRLGLPAHIVIQDQDYNGKVLNVANQPQASSFFSASVKEYATIVSIDAGGTGLRPGMTAKVTILVDDLKNALTVPVSAVVEQKGQFFCWVQAPRGTERRPLKLGRTNDKLIEVIDGVKEGDVVYRNPRAMVEEARQDLPFEKQAEDSKFAAPDASVAGPPQGPGAGAAPGQPAKAGPPRTEKDAPMPADAASGTPKPAVATTPGEPGAAAPNGDAKNGDSKNGGAPREPGKRSGRGPGDLMQYDKDGDKKLSREELPERMQPMFDRMDTNGDGSIDAAEIAEMRKRWESGAGRAGGPGGPGGEGGREGRPGGSKDGAGRGGGGGPEGDRP